MDTHSRIQELAKNSEIENSRNKSHAKISEFTVFGQHVNNLDMHHSKLVEHVTKHLNNAVKIQTMQVCELFLCSSIKLVICYYCATIKSYLSAMIYIPY